MKTTTDDDDDDDDGDDANSNLGKNNVSFSSCFSLRCTTPDASAPVDTSTQKHARRTTRKQRRRKFPSLVEVIFSLSLCVRACVCACVCAQSASVCSKCVQISSLVFELIAYFFPKK